VHSKDTRWKLTIWVKDDRYPGDKYQRELTQKLTAIGAEVEAIRVRMLKGKRRTGSAHVTLVGN
jgi:DUF1365 family protein